MQVARHDHAEVLEQVVEDFEAVVRNLRVELDSLLQLRGDTLENRGRSLLREHANQGLEPNAADVALLLVGLVDDVRGEAVGDFLEPVLLHFPS